MLVRVHRKNVSDARQILRPLVQCDRRQFEYLSFIGRKIFRRRGEIRCGFQAGFLHRQAVFIFVGIFLRIRQQDDIVRVGDRRVIRRRAAHVDQTSRSRGHLIGFDHGYVFQRAGLAVADQTQRHRGRRENSVHLIDSAVRARRARAEYGRIRRDGRVRFRRGRRAAPAPAAPRVPARLTDRTPSSMAVFAAKRTSLM